MNVIWHDNKLIQPNFRPENVRPLEFIVNDNAFIAVCNPYLNDFTENPTHLIRTYRHKIRAGLGVIIPGQARGPAALQVILDHHSVPPVGSAAE